MRSASGVSLTELIVAAALMAVALGLVGEIVVDTTRANTQLVNCIDGTTGANLFVQRIAADVRASSAIGPPSDIATQQLITLGGGYPSGWGTTNSAQTLILQQPALMNSGSDIDGMPLLISKNYFGTGIPPINSPYLDVVVYQVLADPNSPNQYMVQEVRFAGAVSGTPVNNTQLRTAIPLSPPHIVLRGIIGPIGVGETTPSVFVTVQPSTSNPPIGVAVNVELETPVPNTGVNVHHIGLHSEAYLRSAKNQYASNTY